MLLKPNAGPASHLRGNQRPIVSLPKQQKTPTADSGHQFSLWSSSDKLIGCLIVLDAGVVPKHPYQKNLIFPCQLFQGASAAPDQPGSKSQSAKGSKSCLTTRANADALPSLPSSEKALSQLYNKVILNEVRYESSLYAPKFWLYICIVSNEGVHGCRIIFYKIDYIDNYFIK